MDDLVFQCKAVPVHRNAAGHFLELLGGLIVDSSVVSDSKHFRHVAELYLSQEGVDPFSPCIMDAAKASGDRKSSYEKVLHLCVKARCCVVNGDFTARVGIRAEVRLCSTSLRMCSSTPCGE